MYSAYAFLIIEYTSQLQILYIEKNSYLHLITFFSPYIMSPNTKNGGRLQKSATWLTLSGFIRDLSFSAVVSKISTMDHEPFRILWWVELGWLPSRSLSLWRIGAMQGNHIKLMQKNQEELPMSFILFIIHLSNNGIRRSKQEKLPKGKKGIKI